MLAEAFATAAREKHARLSIRTRAPEEGDVPTDYSLALSPLRVGLRERNQPDQFCLDLAMRLSLRKTQSRALSYDSVLVYAGIFPPQNPLRHRPRLYERLVDYEAPCHSLGEWRSPEGAMLIQREVMAGLRTIAQRFVRDIAD